MLNPLIAIVGDIAPGRILTPVSADPETAREAAERIGYELAKAKARLLVYGGPYLEADVIRGYVKANPKEDKSILIWFSKDVEPELFAEELSSPKLFERRADRGTDWEVAFYRSMIKADGLILMGGGDATKITGLVAIGNKMPVLALSQFGGGAAKVWDALSPGEDLPTREEMSLMAQKWQKNMGVLLVGALFDQIKRKQITSGVISPAFPLVAGGLFMAALATVPWLFGNNEPAVWALFIVPLFAGGAGSVIRAIIDKQRSNISLLTTCITGFISGGISGVLFVTAQLTSNPTINQNYSQYANRSLPFALAVGFIAGLTSEAVFGKLLKIDVVKEKGITTSKTD